MDLSTAVPFFRALADESRLKLLGLLAERERSVEELATLLGLRPPTVSHHLSRLKQVGLVHMRADGTTHLYRLDGEALRRLSRQVLARDGVLELAESVPGDTWDRKVLRDFLDGERLKEIPASRKKRDVVLAWLAGRFDAGHEYSETEVNAVIGRHHPDYATLRRELVGAKLMQRERSIYSRTGHPS
jgi:DNA-binding transcriptional ArsR family regulator